MTRRWLIGSCCGAVLAATALAAAAASQVAIVTLADGTRLEGTVVSEDDQQISLVLALAGGTITQTRSFRKADLAGLVRLSDAELAERVRKRAEENVRKYRLDPSTSFAAAYYQQVISNVFRPFLARYPDSPQAPQVAEQLAQWEAEGQIVAGGKAKYRGQWLPAADAAKLYEQDHGQEVLDQARALLRQGKFPEALERLRPLPAEAAAVVMDQTYRQWLSALEQDRQRVNRDLQKYQAQAARAQEQIARSKGTAQVPPKLGTPSVHPLGNASASFVYTRAVEDWRSATDQIAWLQKRLAQVESSITTVQARATSAGVALTAPAGSPAGATVAARPALAAAEDQYSSPPMLRQMSEFFRKYWQWLLLAALLGIWVVTRLMAR